jgi:hypothetical protein
MPVPTKVKSRIAAISTLALLLIPPCSVRAQDAVPGVGVSPPPRTPKSRTLAERVLAPPPEPIVILEDFNGADAGNTVVEIHLDAQRLTVRVGGKLAVESPATTGRKATPSPEGEFIVKGRTEEIEDDNYGNFIDKASQILVAGVFRKLDAAPRGSHFSPVPRKYALDVDGGKIRILAGHVRSTPCTEGSIIVPEAVAWALYEKIPEGAKVRVLKESPAADAAADPATVAPPAP